MIGVFAFLEGIGGPEVFLIGILALLMFGAKRMPELGRAFGRAIREFKKATSGVEENLREVLRETPAPTIRPPVRPTAPRAGTTSQTTTKPEKPLDVTPPSEPAPTSGPSLTPSPGTNADQAPNEPQHY